MKKPSSLATTITLACAIELGVGIMHNVIGNDLSDTVGGTYLNTEVLSSMMATQLQKQMITRGTL